MRTAYGRAYPESSVKRRHSVWIAAVCRPNTDGSLKTWPRPAPSGCMNVKLVGLVVGPVALTISREVLTEVS